MTHNLYNQHCDFYVLTNNLSWFGTLVWDIQEEEEDDILYQQVELPVGKISHFLV